MKKYFVEKHFIDRYAFGYKLRIRDLTISSPCIYVYQISPNKSCFQHFVSNFNFFTLDFTFGKFPRPFLSSTLMNRFLTNSASAYFRIVFCIVLLDFCSFKNLGPDILHTPFTLFQFLVPPLSDFSPNLLVKSPRV